MVPRKSSWSTTSLDGTTARLDLIHMAVVVLIPPYGDLDVVMFSRSYFAATMGALMASFGLALATK